MAVGGVARGIGRRLIPSSVKINNSEDITPEWVLGITVDGENFYKNLGILPVNSKSSIEDIMRSFMIKQYLKNSFIDYIKDLYAR